MNINELRKLVEWYKIPLSPRKNIYKPLTFNKLRVFYLLLFKICHRFCHAFCPTFCPFFPCFPRENSFFWIFPSNILLSKITYSNLLIFNALTIFPFVGNCTILKNKERISENSKLACRQNACLRWLFHNTFFPLRSPYTSLESAAL